jgi:chemotaxis protein MotA
MYVIMQTARKQGLTELESEVENPSKGKLFSMWDHHLQDFVCDTLRMAMTGGPSPFELDQMMEADMEVHHHSANLPVNALNTVADSLPGLGIVAAVLGVVITMGALGGPPEEIGHKVAAALVGTFLGILLCYGLLGPMAAKMGKAAEEEGQFYHVVRVSLIAFLKGASPQVAIEFGRRATPGTVRPSFMELENACKGKT